jgi:hypothetical protein
MSIRHLKIRRKSFGQMKLLLFLAIARENTEFGDGIIRSTLKLVYVHSLKRHQSSCFGVLFHKITRDLFIFRQRRPQRKEELHKRKLMTTIVSIR